VTEYSGRRLVSNIKGGEDKQAGTSSSIWDISIEEAEGFDLHEELKEASGIGRRKRRGVSILRGLAIISRSQRFPKSIAVLETNLCYHNK
jgi:hypothetical protein